MAHGRRAGGRLPALARAPGSRGVVPAVSHRCSKEHVRRGVALTLVTAARVSKCTTHGGRAKGWARDCQAAATARVGPVRARRQLPLLQGACREHERECGAWRCSPLLGWADLCSCTIEPLGPVL